MSTLRYRQARKVTLVGIVVNTFLGILKVVFGVVGHSQALFADGLHSFSDLITDLLVIVAAKFGSKKPDENHPYGHRRIETVSTVALAVFLIVVGCGIIFDAFHVMVGQVFIKPNVWILIVAVLSVVLNEWLYRYTLKTADKIRSNLLSANAWHHRSDAWSSVVVVIGIGGALLGLHYFDSVAAIIVALFIIKIGCQLVWRSISELIDTGADSETLKEITRKVEKVDGVKKLNYLRTRLVGGDIFVEVYMQVDGRITVAEGHDIGTVVARKLKQGFVKITDVVVHIDPEAQESGI
jgi:cation diffusion facilitator family transporter